VTEKARLDRIGKLLVQLAEAQATSQAIISELVQLAAGTATDSEHTARAMRFFDEVWCERYAPGRVKGYAWDRAKDLPNLRRLVKQLGVQEVEGRMVAFLKSDDAFYTRVGNCHKFSLFVHGINGFVSVQRRAEATWVCPDTPCCPPGTTLHDCNLRAMLNTGRRERGETVLL